MEDYEKRIRAELVETLGILSEKLIRREPPFDTLPLQHEIIPYFYEKYLEYFDEIEIDLRSKILERLVDYAKWQIRSMLIRGIPSFNSLYPDHVDTGSAFKQWIRHREEHNVSIPRNIAQLDVNFKMSRVIKHVMKQRMPLFEYDKSVYIPGTVPFSKVFLSNNKIFIIADIGTKRQFVDFMIGLDSPRLFIDIANFFGKAQSVYEYSSEQEATIAVNKALDMIEVLLPYFAEKVEKTLLLQQFPEPA